MADPRLKRVLGQETDYSRVVREAAIIHAVERLAEALEKVTPVLERMAGAEEGSGSEVALNEPTAEPPAPDDLPATGPKGIMLLRWDPDNPQGGTWWFTFTDGTSVRLADIDELWSYISKARLQAEREDIGGHVRRWSEEWWRQERERRAKKKEATDG